MKQAWLNFGYGLTYGPASWWRDRWCDLWFRFYCPRPVIRDPSAKACVRAGKCGCSNLKEAV
jgi:hypothetical protein